MEPLLCGPMTRQLKINPANRLSLQNTANSASYS